MILFIFDIKNKVDEKKFTIGHNGVQLSFTAIFHANLMQ